MNSEVKKAKITLLNNKVYLVGKEIMGIKQVYYALQVVYGIGPTRAKYICKWLSAEFNIKPEDYIGNLKDDIIKDLNDFISNTWLIEGDLRKEIAQNISIKVNIQCREGKRHAAGLPLHGRTKTNGRTARKRRQA